MSLLENQIQKKFIKNNVSFELQKQMPIIYSEIPWRGKNSIKRNPTCDFYIKEVDLYIEVKGFMTIESMSKMMFFCMKDFNYFIFQGTEHDWNPFYNSPLKNLNEYSSKNQKLQNNVDQQINEIIYFINNPKEFSNQISIDRLNQFILKKIQIFEEWTSNKFPK